MAMVTGVFKDSDSADSACRAVIEMGYGSDDINVVMSKDALERYFPPTNPTVADAATVQEQTADNAEPPASKKLGGPMGGTIATLAPIVAAVGVLLIPGLGLVAGPAALAVAAAGSVGVAGGVVSMLTDWGIPGARQKQYADTLLAGGILLGVKAHSAADATSIQQKWLASGGEYVHA